MVCYRDTAAGQTFPVLKPGFRHRGRLRQAEKSVGLRYYKTYQDAGQGRNQESQQGPFPALSLFKNRKHGGSAWKMIEAE